jgi:hypothetical protein
VHPRLGELGTERVGGVLVVLLGLADLAAGLAAVGGIAAELAAEFAGRHDDGRTPGAGAEVGRADLGDVAAAGEPDGRRGLRLPHGGVDRRGHAGAGQPAAVPAEPPGAFPQAFHQVPARPRLPGLGVDVGLVADPQLHRVDAEFPGEFVQGDLRAEHARALAGRPHP